MMTTVGQVLTTGAGASVVVGAIATLASWSFGRGLVSGVGFPSSLVGLRNSIDVAPSIAFGATWKFLFSLILGYAVNVFTWKNLVAVELVVTITWFIFVIVALFTINNPTSERNSPIRVTVAEFAPIFIGYTIHSYFRGNISARYGVLLLYAVFMSLIVWLNNLNRFGFDTGKMIRDHLWEDTHTARLAQVKLSDFPEVILKTKEKLTAEEDVKAPGEMYQYPIGEHAFLRLILMDGNNYYFVEGNYIGSEPATPFSLKKDLVSSLVFLGEAPGRRRSLATRELPKGRIRKS
jgi:hypothetical protein